MKLFRLVAVTLFLLLANLPASAEPVDGDSCSGYPEGAFMQSSGAGGTGTSHFLSCRSNVWIDFPGNAATAPTSGLIHHWPLNDNPSSGIVVDVVGGSNCTIGGNPTSVAARDGNGFYFTSDAADCGRISAVEGASAVTISAWMRRSAAGAEMRIGKAGDGTSSLSMSFWTGGNLFLEACDNDSSWEEGEFALNNTNWTHIVMVFDGTQTGNASRLRAYINGQSVTLGFSTTIPAALNTSTIPFMINDWTSGYADDVRIYNRALTAQEANDLYMATGGT